MLLRWVSVIFEIIRQKQAIKRIEKIKTTNLAILRADITFLFAERLKMSDEQYSDDFFVMDEIKYTQNEPLVTKKVASDEKNMRLDKFLVLCFPTYSRARMIKFIETDCVKFVGQDKYADKADLKVKEGDAFIITMPESVPATPQPEKIDIDILYEDADLIVVNKPAGMVVHPGAGNYTGTLVNALLYHCRESLSGIGGVLRPGIVHRIDKDTSGVLVVAKNDFAHTHLAEQFSKHTIERVYHAFVWNVLKKKDGIVSSLIGRSSSNRQKMAIVTQNGKHAVTHYECLASYPKAPASYVKCVLETGRTHQIRVHMSSLGHSLIGDSVYGTVPKMADSRLRFFNRQALHAGFLSFVHPKTNERISFSAPLPTDMQALKDLLEDEFVIK